jgi:hypothetical protein
MAIFFHGPVVNHFQIAMSKSQTDSFTGNLSTAVHESPERNHSQFRNEATMVAASVTMSAAAFEVTSMAALRNGELLTISSVLGGNQQFPDIHIQRKGNFPEQL